MNKDLIFKYKEKECFGLGDFIEIYIEEKNGLYYLIQNIGTGWNDNEAADPLKSFKTTINEKCVDEIRKIIDKHDILKNCPCDMTNQDIRDGKEEEYYFKGKKYRKHIHGINVTTCLTESFDVDKTIESFKYGNWKNIIIYLFRHEISQATEEIYDILKNRSDIK